MKKLFLSVLILLFSAPCWAATPTLIQANLTSSTEGQTITQYKHRMTKATLAGNLIVLFVTTGTNDPSAAPTDYVGNTYSLILTHLDSGTSGQRLAIYRSFNSTVGARVVTVNTPSTTNFVAVLSEEWNNILTTDPN